MDRFLYECAELREDAQIARRRAGELGILKLDLRSRLDGQNVKLRELVEIFMVAGSHDPDIRDFVGLGHARLLLHAPGQKFDGFLQAIGAGKKYVAEMFYISSKI